MKKFQTFAYIFLLFTLYLSACSGATPEEISNPEPEVETPESVEVAPPATPEISKEEKEPVESANPVPRELVEKARADLSEHLGISTEQISVVEARAVEWPDASLGCPQPEMMYATVITPGFWILLGVDGVTYPYHTDAEEQVILCQYNLSDPDGPRPFIPIDPGEIKDGEPWMPVD
jgi:hypothetical protein